MSDIAVYIRLKADMCDAKRPILVGLFLRIDTRFLHGKIDMKH